LLNTVFKEKNDEIQKKTIQTQLNERKANEAKLKKELEEKENNSNKIHASDENAIDEIIRENINNTKYNEDYKLNIYQILKGNDLLNNLENENYYFHNKDNILKLNSKKVLTRNQIDTNISII
jgi:hypothetical protein